MSAIPVQKFREIVFQVLFSIEMAHADQEALETLLSKELGVSPRAVSEAYQRARGILDQAKELDLKISSALLSYDIARISSVEKTILRLGTFELFSDADIPPKVAISEAVRLTRKFSSPEAASFVNAVLDSLYKKSLGQHADDTALAQSADELTRFQQISELASQEPSAPQPEEDEESQ